MGEFESFKRSSGELLLLLLLNSAFSSLWSEEVPEPFRGGELV